jgi:phosphoglycolate phosphatase-like HAD superfamily hydrolase
VTHAPLPEASDVVRHIGKPHPEMLSLLGFEVSGARPGIPLKPAPDSIIAALTALKCLPEHALMVGDTPADILAGKAAGVRTCAVTYGFGDPDELRLCEPTYMVTSFAGLVAIPETLVQRHTASSP